MEYIKEGFTLPVPFNLIPRPISIYVSLKNMLKICRDSEKSIINNSNDDLATIYEVKSQNLNNNSKTEPVKVNFLKLS